jgi:hypothetical protein
VTELCVPGSKGAALEQSSQSKVGPQLKYGTIKNRIHEEMLRVFWRTSVDMSADYVLNSNGDSCIGPLLYV